MATLLAACGAGVVVNGREVGAVNRTVAEIADAGGRAVGFAGSPANETTAHELIEVCQHAFGHVDILVNCAGVAEPPRSSILDIRTSDFDDLLEAHLGTVFHTCRAAAPVMVAQGRGAIINTSSVAFLGHYGGTGYPAGKGAVNGLTMAIAAELDGHGVRANVICPGAKTRLSTGLAYEEHIQELYSRGILDEVSMRASLRPAPAEYVAPAYAYLASDLARTVTGQIIVAAGGFIGRIDQSNPVLVGYRDHHESPPWTVAELHTMLAGP